MIRQKAISPVKSLIALDQHGITRQDGIIATNTAYKRGGAISLMNALKDHGRKT